MTTLLVASLAAVAGPLAELPFLSLGWWEYYDSPALYYPLGEVLSSSSSSSSSLGIHCLTGPCYFAVTMDAIALGRWFAAIEKRTMSRQDQQQADEDKDADDTSGDALEMETTNLLLVKDRPASPVLRPTAVVGPDEPPPDNTTMADHTATTMNKR
jgi:hypothetical protein